MDVTGVEEIHKACHADLAPGVEKTVFLSHNWEYVCIFSTF